MVGLFEPPEVAEDRRKKKTKRVSHRHLAFVFQWFDMQKPLYPWSFQSPAQVLSHY